MKRRIYIEVDTDEDMNGMVKDITELVMNRDVPMLSLQSSRKFFRKEFPGGIPDAGVYEW